MPRECTHPNTSKGAEAGANQWSKHHDCRLQESGSVKIQRLSSASAALGACGTRASLDVRSPGGRLASLRAVRWFTTPLKGLRAWSPGSWDQYLVLVISDNAAAKHPQPCQDGIFAPLKLFAGHSATARVSEFVPQRDYGPLRS